MSDEDLELGREVTPEEQEQLEEAEEVEKLAVASIHSAKSIMPRLSPENEQEIRNTVRNLARAIRLAGGNPVGVMSKLLHMTVPDFIGRVVGPNSIRFFALRVPDDEEDVG